MKTKTKQMTTFLLNHNETDFFSDPNKYTEWRQQTQQRINMFF